MTEPNTPEEIAKIIFNLGKLHERGEVDYDLTKPTKLIECYSQSTIESISKDINELIKEASDPNLNQLYREGLEKAMGILNKHRNG